jgi:hypothetical protein
VSWWWRIADAWISFWCGHRDTVYERDETHTWLRCVKCGLRTTGVELGPAPRYVSAQPRTSKVLGFRKRA